MDWHSDLVLRGTGLWEMACYEGFMSCPYGEVHLDVCPWAGLSCSLFGLHFYIRVSWFCCNRPPCARRSPGILSLPPHTLRFSMRWFVFDYATTWGTLHLDTCRYCVHGKLQKVYFYLTLELKDHLVKNNTDTRLSITPVTLFLKHLAFQIILSVTIQMFGCPPSQVIHD